MAERIGPNGKPKPEQAMGAGARVSDRIAVVPLLRRDSHCADLCAGGASLGAGCSGVHRWARCCCGWRGRDIERVSGNNAADFVGYPMHLRALLVPGILAVLVAVGHWVVPNWAALSVISLASMAVVAVTLLVGQGPVEATAALGRHIRDRLPSMSGELVLFLAAGAFASGLRSLIDSGGIWMPFTGFGVGEAAIVLAVMILLSAAGIHTVISITMAAAWLAPLHPQPTLMAIVFVQSWAIGLAAGPMSGIHLAMQGRYGIPATTLSRGNIRYCVGAYIVAVLWLGMVGSWLGVRLFPTLV